MMKFPKYTTLICFLLVSCSSTPSVPNEITGTVSSSFEIFSFEPFGSEFSHWINGESYKAKNWSIFEEVYRPLDTKAEDQYLNPSWIYICIKLVNANSRIWFILMSASAQKQTLDCTHKYR